MDVLRFDVSSAGDLILINHIEVPWSTDCSGINILLVLLAIGLWKNRDEKDLRQVALRIALLIPASILANVLRVLTLIAYRLFFYPEVESPELHYYFGFIWILPFAFVAIPRNKGAFPGPAVSMIHTAAVVCLLVPLVSLQGHIPLIVASIYLLGRARFQKPLLLVAGVWVLGAMLILWAEIDSLWLPWMLVCPLFISVPELRLPSIWVALLAACPITHLFPLTTG